MNKSSTPRTGKAGKPPSVPAAATTTSRKRTTASKRASTARTGNRPEVDHDMRHAMIAQAAYFRAEKRGFVHGCELDDWIEAEREITRMLGD